MAGWTDCDERARADAEQRIGPAPRNRDPREAQAGPLAGSSRTTASQAAHDQGAGYSDAWHTASTLLPSGSRTKAP